MCSCTILTACCVAKWSLDTFSTVSDHSLVESGWCMHSWHELWHSLRWKLQTFHCVPASTISTFSVGLPVVNSPSEVFLGNTDVVVSKE